MAELQIWAQIPNDSKLQMSLSAPPGEIVSVQVSGNGAGEAINIPNPIVQPGPASVTLQAPNDYSFEVRLTFADACTAKFSARIVKPVNADGTFLPYDLDVPGTKGSVTLINLQCLTKKPA